MTTNPSTDKPVTRRTYTKIAKYACSKCHHQFQQTIRYDAPISDGHFALRADCPKCRLCMVATRISVEELQR